MSFHECVCVGAFSVGLCQRVWPHSSWEAAVPQRDGVRQPMNEPTKVVTSSLLHSSLETSTCFIIMTECGDTMAAALNRVDMSLRHHVSLCFFFCGCFSHIHACVCVCVSAIRRVVAPLAADEALCFKSRLPTLRRATVTTQITSFIHTAEAPTPQQPSLLHFWLLAIWLFIYPLYW